MSVVMVLDSTPNRPVRLLVGDSGKSTRDFIVIEGLNLRRYDDKVPAIAWIEFDSASTTHTLSISNCQNIIPVGALSVVDGMTTYMGEIVHDEKKHWVPKNVLVMRAGIRRFLDPSLCSIIRVPNGWENRREEYEDDVGTMLLHMSKTIKGLLRNTPNNYINTGKHNITG